jgi:TolA-binding protein
MLKKFALSLLVLCQFYFSQAQHTQVFQDEESLFRTGLELFDKKKYNAARGTFEKYIEVSNQGVRTSEAEYYIGLSALYLYHADGEQLVERYTKNNPQHIKSVLAYYELGSFYFKEKNYAKAVEYLEKVNTSALNQGQKTEALFKLAYSYFNRQNFDKALSYFNQIKKDKHHYTHAASYYAGFINFRNGNFDEALKDLTKAGENEAYTSIVPYMIVNVYYKQDKPNELIAYREKLLTESKSYKNEEEINLLTGDSYFKLGNFKKATEYFEQYLKDKKGNPEPNILYKVGYANFIAGENKKAIDNFKIIAGKDDTLGQLSSYHLGLLYLQEDNKIFASNSFDKARKSNFNEGIKEQAAFNYAKVNLELGKFSEAIFAFTNFLTKYPSSLNASEANDLLSEAYFNTNDYNQAIKFIEGLPQKSQAVKKTYQKVTYHKGTEYFNNARYFNAVQMFDKSLQFPVDPELVLMANFWKAEAYSIGKKYPEAINAYNEVIKGRSSIQPNISLKARYGLGYAHYNSGSYDRALLHFKEYVEALEKAENKLFYNDALLRLADCYYAIKGYNQALSFYDKAIQQSNPDKDYAYFQKGLVSSILNKIEDAHQNFDIVIQKYPKSQYVDDAIFQKAQMDFERGKYEVAIKEFTNLLDNKPQSSYIPYALSRRAISNFNLKNYDKTSADYIRILDEFTTHKIANGALMGLQEVLTLQGKSDLFEPYLAKYKQANPENQALESIEFETAKNLYFNEKYDKAISSLNDYIKNYPNSGYAFEARFYIAESYYRTNNVKNALENYYHVVRDNKTSFVNRSIQRIAELEYQSGNYKEAMVYFHQLASIARNKREQYNAWAGLMESHFMMSKYDSVNHYAKLILDKASVSANAQNKAQLFLGKSAFAKGDYDKAMDEFLLTLNTAKDENGAEAQYLIAEVFYNRKQYKQSIEALFTLNASFGIYERWLGKSFLLMADNYVALNENFQAKATLNSLIEKSPNRAIVEEAKIKLAKIKEREKQEKARKKREEELEKADQIIFEEELTETSPKQ